MIGIYGANGFIGTAVTRHLLACGHKVKAVSRSFSDGFIEEFDRQLVVETLDVQDIDALRESLSGVTTAIHLVSSVSPGLGNQNIEADISSNLVANINFAKECADRSVKKLIFLSSGGTVYGRPEQTPIPESHPCNPISSYGLVKYCSEKYIQMFGEVLGLDYTIVRLANPFGPGQVFKNAQGLIPAILQKAENGEAVTILGDGSAERDYIYIEDAAVAIEKMIDNPAASKTVLNLGSGEGRSILDVVSSIEAALGKTLEKEFLPGRDTDVKKSILDITRAKDVLGWAPGTNFVDGVKKTVQS